LIDTMKFSSSFFAKCALLGSVAISNSIPHVVAFVPFPTSIKQTTTRQLASFTMAATVTKEDLLGARDAIDKLLREKACGTFCLT
jgi:hypothetical protein